LHYADHQGSSKAGLATGRIGARHRHVGGASRYPGELQAMLHFKPSCTSSPAALQAMLHFKAWRTSSQAALQTLAHFKRRRIK
jgi:hypothetical protein